jgi:hypothetical protein
MPFGRAISKPQGGAERLHGGNAPAVSYRIRVIDADLVSVDASGTVSVLV